MEVKWLETSAIFWVSCHDIVFLLDFMLIIFTFIPQEMDFTVVNNNLF